jgi:hypothetical protein
MGTFTLSVLAFLVRYFCFGWRPSSKEMIVILRRVTVIFWAFMLFLGIMLALGVNLK